MIADATTTGAGEETKADDPVVAPPAANAGAAFGGRNEARGGRGGRG